MPRKNSPKIKALSAHNPEQDDLLVSNLLRLMAKLRGPQGCPWDRAQTKDSLKKFLLEESYEVLEAIEENDPEKLKEELGDLLLQIIFISRIAEENKEFSFRDVVGTLINKLLRRHPHVFHLQGYPPAKMPIPDAAAVAKLWQEVKKGEKKQSSSSILNGLPLSLPALERAQRLSEKAAQVGFDWPNIKEVWKKVGEEIEELKKAEKAHSPKRVKEEFGDLLFTLTNWARFRGFSAEEALRQTIRRFTRRFRRLELEIKRKKVKWADLSLAELDRLWDKIKKSKK
ncbi:MAG: nucleoside triphosphate pyrophosphohydrolase [Thermodesulfobacteriota bacterium]